MPAWRSHLFDAPVFADVERSQQARMFHLVGWSAIAVATVFLGAMLILEPHRTRTVFALGAVYALTLPLLFVNMRGYPRVAGTALVAGLIALVTGLSLQAGGIRSPGVSLYFILVLTAGVLLGQSAGRIAAGVCSALGLALVLLERVGMLQPPVIRYDAMSVWLLLCLYMGLVLILTRLARQEVAGSLKRAELELVERRAAEARLQQELKAKEDLLHDLGERVKELTLLHSAAKLLRDRDVDASVFRELVAKIPGAWRRPEICEARITYRDLQVATPGWRESRRRLSAPIMTSAGDGRIEVVYLDSTDASAVAPFLEEEVALLASLAEMLVNWLEQNSAEHRRHKTEYQLRHAQKMEALGTLSGGIAHDFNNILSAIGGNAELALADLADDHPARVSVTQVVASNARAAELVKRLLLFSRRQDAERRPGSLRPVVEEVARLLGSSFRPRVSVRAAIANELPLVNADASQMYQVVLNLGTNAGQAMEAHGGTIHIEVDAVDVTREEVAGLRDLSPGAHVRLTVRDTGVGMSPDTQERMFEPFFTTRGPGGSGLGLSVVHGIVHDHDGAITVESALGKGTTVRVWFPAAGSAGVAAPEAPGGVPRGNGEHVLCLDDEEAIVTLMPRLLKHIGYRCTTFSDPLLALAAFRGSPGAFDAVMTDYAMPVMNGAQFIREVRAIRADIPALVASGFSDELAKVAEPGVVRVPKPLTVRQLGDALAAVLRKT